MKKGPLFGNWIALPFLEMDDLDLAGHCSLGQIPLPLQDNGPLFRSGQLSDRLNLASLTFGRVGCRISLGRIDQAEGVKVHQRRL
jgi:hypothetical protein